MGRKCSVKLCESNKPGKTTEHITLFSIPKNPTLYDQWTKIVNAWNCNNNEVKYLCQKHFEVDDINKTFDGFSIEDNKPWANRTKFTLKHGAIPKIFNISTFHDLFNVFETIKIPKTWISYMDENLISFCNLKPITGKNKMCIEKQIVFSKNLDILFYINDKLLNIDIINDCQLFFSRITKYDIEDVILNFDKKKVCRGGPFSANFPGIVIKYGIIHSNDIWYHKNCTVLVNTSKSRCEWCERLCSIFRVKMHYLESCKKKKSIQRFEMFCESSNVFEETLSYFLEHKPHLLTFPCESHKSDVLNFIITYYITMRMRQYSQMSNQKQIKVCSKKKKLSKLVKT